MPHPNLTFSSADVIRIYEKNLLGIEQREVKRYFETIIDPEIDDERRRALLRTQRIVNETPISQVDLVIATLQTLVDVFEPLQSETAIENFNELNDGVLFLENAANLVIDRGLFTIGTALQGYADVFRFFRDIFAPWVALDLALHVTEENIGELRDLQFQVSVWTPII